MSPFRDDETTADVPSMAAQLDRQLTATDWSVLPDGSIKQFVRAPSGNLAHVSLGPEDGKRVLLVPGVTGSKEDFTLMMPLFAEAGFRVESFDLAGQYESASAGPERRDPPSNRYEMSLFVDDLIAVLRSGETPVHVLGYSFAGTVASIAATSHPELFASLTLLSTPPVAGQVFRKVKRVGAMSAFVPGRSLGVPFVAALRYNVHGAPKDRASFVTERLKFTRPSSVGDILALMKQTPDVVGELRATGIPMLVTAGSGDLWRAEDHRTFARRLGARVLIVETGHGPCETTPHQLVEAMLSLMRDSER